MALAHIPAVASLPLAASIIDQQPILVAAAGLVVVLAIILVFVMVIRSNGANRRTSMGLGYDPQQGPLGQPRSGPSAPNPYQRSSGAGWAAGADQNAYGQPGQAGGTPGVWGQRYDGPPSGVGGPWAAPGQTPSQAPSQTPWQAQAPGYGGGMGSRPLSPAERGAAPGWDALGQAPSGAHWGTGANGQNNPWGQDAPANPWGGAPTPMPPSARPFGGAPSVPTPGAGAPWGGPQAGGPQGGASAFEQQPYGQSAGPGPQAGRAAGRIGALEVRSEKDRGRVYELRKDRTTIGRSRESDIFLDDLAVSRLHILIFRDEQGRYVLHDENSANGAYINGQRVMRDQVLEDGDEIQVGQVVLAFGRR